jgi:hypothetical protein
MNQATAVHPLEARMKANYNRTVTHRHAVHENKQFAEVLKDYEKNYVPDSGTCDALELENAKKIYFVRKAHKAINSCSSAGLFSTPLNGDASHKFIMAHTCKHKICNVCNWNRSKALRRKWRAFFTSEDKVVVMNDARQRLMGETKFEVTLNGNKLVTKPRAYSGSEIYSACDFMHLVLTVPHSEGTFEGETFYAKKLIDRFNQMRKMDFWKETVLGGEYSCEITKNENGLHIHLHVLILVPKHIKQSRNYLSKEILSNWNRITSGDTKARWDWKNNPAHLSAIQGLQKGYKNLTYKYIEENGVTSKKNIGSHRLNKFILSLNPTGATFIGLKSLFKEVTKEHWDRLRGSSKFTENGKYYSYCSGKNQDDTLHGIMECLKYHFEPLALKDSDGNYDMDLITQILPEIFGRPLYKKFGVFHGVKELNVSETSEELLADEITDTLEELGTEAFHPDTLEPMDVGETQFFIGKMQGIRLNPLKHRMKVDKGYIVDYVPPNSSSGTRAASLYYVRYMLGRQAKPAHGNINQFSKN